MKVNPTEPTLIITAAQKDIYPGALEVAVFEAFGGERTLIAWWLGRATTDNLSRAASLVQDVVETWVRHGAPAVVELASRRA